MPRIRGVLLVRLLAGTTSLLVSAACLEVLLRASGLSHPRVDMFDGRIVKYKPFATYVNTRENRNRVRLNNLGFHDRNRDLTNANLRLLFLGDSMLEGNQVPVRSLFTTLLEDQLRQQNPSVEILNGGISGTGTLAQKALWDHFFKNRVRVDHVVLCVFLGNDLENNHPALGTLVGYPPGNSQLYLDSNGEIVLNRVEYPFVQRVAKRMADHSALANLMYERLYLLRRAFLRKRLSPGSVQVSPPTSAEVEAAWNESQAVTLRVIEAWAGELRSEGIGFSIVVIPQLEVPPGSGRGSTFKREFHAKLERVCMAQQISCLFTVWEPKDAYDFFSFDAKTLGHFNHAGHQQAALQIGRWLEDTGLVRPPPATRSGAASASE